MWTPTRQERLWVNFRKSGGGWVGTPVKLGRLSVKLSHSVGGKIVNASYDIYTRKNQHPLPRRKAAWERIKEGDPQSERGNDHR